MGAALERAGFLWNATETVQLFPSDQAVERFFEWMRIHRLGRKRLLDTMMAATFAAADIQSVITLNGSDFKVFDRFTIIEP